mmetsp:Transcript_32756/g.75416  ORF Transcript_32756/g.75416 Transcript_32756/m.75416 type:complete len:331 (-) Transcript_32756:457-1449(-)
MQRNVDHVLSALGPSLPQFLREEQQLFPDISEALPCILCAIASVGKAVSEIVRKLGLVGITGRQGGYNVYGDEQRPLDLLAHHYFLRALETTHQVAAVLSEEEANIIEFTNHLGNHIVALDPLDGSPNIDVNAAIGSIFSVYQRNSAPSIPIQQKDVLQRGERQLAGGYILYSTSTTFVYTARHGVHGFTYEPSRGEFFLAHRAMQMPQEGESYAINDGYFDTFPRYVQDYIWRCRQNGHVARYIGALVADFHRHLVKGGIYLYPPTHKNPAGKLRLMLECNALALIAAQAGGTASNGQQTILTVLPHTIHQRVPLYIGSTNMVQCLLAS